jgi:hypothetical protein
MDPVVENGVKGFAQNNMSKINRKIIGIINVWSTLF